MNIFGLQFISGTYRIQIEILSARNKVHHVSLHNSTFCYLLTGAIPFESFSCEKPYSQCVGLTFSQPHFTRHDPLPIALISMYSGVTRLVHLGWLRGGGGQRVEVGGASRCDTI